MYELDIEDSVEIRDPLSDVLDETKLTFDSVLGTFDDGFVEVSADGLRGEDEQQEGESAFSSRKGKGKVKQSTR